MTFQINGHTYRIEEKQSANPDSYIWNATFTVFEDEKSLKQFSDLMPALLFVLFTVSKH